MSLITCLTLENFRNYAELRLETAAQFIILSGNNGAGKTNILEAVSLLAPGRGLRRAALSQIARDGGNGSFAVAAQVDDITLGTGTTVAQPDRRKTRINSSSCITNDLGKWLSLLWLTPAMDRLFIEAAAGRRNFLDRLVTSIEPPHARNVARYEAARKERNRLLSDDLRPEPQWLDGLDSQLAEYGGAVATARFRLVRELNSKLAAADEGLFASARIEVLDESLREVSQLREKLLSSRNADRAAKRTIYGPHRTDIRVIHRTKNQSAEKCSTGDQKALLFSIILAQADLIAAERGAKPILLLDEVAAHLDPARRAALFFMLEARGGQIWLTGTESELFKGVPSSQLHFEVDDGAVGINQI